MSRRKPENLAGRQYRLPTEAEWEYACRAGISSQPFFLRSTLRTQDANFDDEADNEDEIGHTRPVGSYPPNAFGLYDMHGNVWEWCADEFEATYYSRSPRQDPEGDPHVGEKVFRGGAWRSWTSICRAACRSADWEDFADDYIGLRAAITWTRDLVIDEPTLTPK